MDAGVIGSIVTVVLFVLFIGIVWWAYHRGNRKRFEEAAQLPFQEEDHETRRP
ncbi:MAG: cbb3-type cytochrome c oxidase subunit 3 [Thiobacillaceae bacterium]|nr:cbb3-type cytochrome c oxidase subunit 3 [Thiobacillaceae bacterium]MCX7672359.1 cbb3-type cytochrome c oxidase subunit 3 [Thiobacillaceae bacterium]MDW8322487.1 cbb3-type cytochrome c oxidase subunit 3 [Burkholderiales bacterium]